jgi:hypothetical protein
MLKEGNTACLLCHSLYFRSRGDKQNWKSKNVEQSKKKKYPFNRPHRLIASSTPPRSSSLVHPHLAPWWMV